METRVNEQFVKDSIREAAETLRGNDKGAKSSVVDVNELDRLSRLTRKLEDQFTEQSISTNGRFRVIEERIGSKLVEKDFFQKVIGDLKNKLEPQLEELMARSMQQKAFIEDNT